MAGNKIGGQKAALTNKRLHGDDFYKRIGAKGGAASGTGGFFANRQLASEAGRKGGTISRRGSAKPFVVDDTEFGEGFFEPTWKQRMLGRLRIYNGK